MMNYKEFKEALLTDLGNIDFKSKGMDVDIENPGSIDGYQDAMTVTFRRSKEQKIGAAVELTTIYEDYEGGMAYAEILKKIRGAIEEVEEIPEVKYDVANWEVMKDKVEVILKCREGNGRYLKNSVHTYIEDMVMFYIFVFGETERRENIGYVSEKILKAWDISKEELKKTAIANTEKNHPAEIKGLEDFMAEMGLGGEPDTSEEIAWLITNHEKEFGAAVITYPGLLDRVAEQLDDDLFVIASSVHEVIVMRAHEKEPNNIEGLRELITYVNATMVEASEKLSDHLYYYDRSAHRFEMVEHRMERAGKAV